MRNHRYLSLKQVAAGNTGSRGGSRRRGLVLLVAVGVAAAVAVEERSCSREAARRSREAKEVALLLALRAEEVQVAADNRV